MKVIIQKDLYERSNEVFVSAQNKHEIEFLVTNILDEEAMLKHHKNGINCFVIGAEKYSDSFYDSLLKGSVVIRYGVGYNAVPVSLCKEKGIQVAYTPGTLTDSVVEHTIALLLATARNISVLDQSVHQHEWKGIRGVELKGKTIAILGYGNIGKAVAHIAHTGFGMNVNVFNHREIEKISEINIATTDFRTAVENADIVSVHMAATPDTAGYINTDKIAMMKDGVILINTARGELINETDLYTALEKGKIVAAGLDVFAKEPYNPTNEHDFRTLDNVVLTPHCGSNTFEASSRMAESVVKNILAYYNKGQMTLVPECVQSSN